MTPPGPTIHALAALAALAISFVSATGGITGAFLLLPFQVSILGLTSPAVTATNHLYNVVAAPGGFLSYWRERRLFWPVAGVLIAGSAPGILGGIALRVRFLSGAGRFQVFAGAVLVVCGVVLLVRSILRRRAATAEVSGEIVLTRFDWRRLSYRFANETHEVRVPHLFFFSVLVGLIGGAYGIGGGIFTAAYLVGIAGLPVHTTAGATLVSTFVASCTGAVGFAMLDWTGGGAGAQVSPLWTLGLAMGAGGLVGGYLGAKVQRFLPSLVICVALSLFMLILGIGYIVR
jgi:uncharacterized membrane protein YfcA